MSGLASPLAFPMGGGVFAPFIVNLSPSPDEPDFNLTDPVRLTIRDAETYVDPTVLRVSAGYALTKGQGDVFFDEDLGLLGTFFSSVVPGFLDPTDPDLLIVSEGVQITKTVAGIQPSSVFTPIEAGAGFPDAMVTAVLRPDIVTIGETGAVLGLEHGPRNLAAYLFFESVAGLPYIRIAGPADGTGTRVPDRAVAYDWSDIQRYIIIWNEVLGVMELYSVKSDVTSLITTEPIANFQQFDTSGSGSPSVRQSGAANLTAIYGIEGASGDRVTIGNVAITNNVAYPIIGIARPGQFETIRRTDETIRYLEGGDPRDLLVSPWFGPPINSVFPNQDTTGGVVVLSEGARLSKVTPGTTYAMHREEPGLRSSNNHGFLFEAEFSALPVLKVGERITGMGFVVHDGQSVFFLSLIDGLTKNIGLLLNGGDPTTTGDFIYPSVPVDWSVTTKIRFVVDPKRDKIEMYLASDIKTPILTTAFDRNYIATPADMGLVAVAPIMAFGHINELATAGSFEIRNFLYSHFYQAWEASDGSKPDVSPTDPTWLIATAGFQEISPLYGLHLLGGGYGPTPLGYYIQSGTGPSGSASITSDDQLEIVADPGETFTYFRTARFGSERGAVLETSFQITSHKPHARSGVFLVLDDGLKAYMLSFVDTDIGKFAGVAVRAGLNSFVERVGTDGEAESLSFRVDWSEPHSYRMERRPLDGLYIFVDQDPEPALVILDSDRVDFPSSQFLSPTVAFGVLSSEGSVSLWDYARTMWGTGYEVSFKRNIDTAGLEEEIRNTQAIIVASADDV